MAWAKIDGQFHSHPKHLRAGLAANGLFARGVAYAAMHYTDGFLPVEWVRGQLSSEEEQGLPARLVECGVWEEIEGGFMIHDFLKFNMSRRQWEAAQKAGRKGARNRWQGAQK